MVEFPPSTDLVRIVQSVEALSPGSMQSEAVLDPVRPVLRRWHSPRREPDPITAGESELVSIKAEKKLELVFFFSVHEASNHDWM
jgi:hypothetical protein